MAENWGIESSLRRRFKLSLRAELADFGIDAKERLLEWGRDWGLQLSQCGPPGTKNPQEDFAVEERDVQAIGSDSVAGRAWDPVDESLEPKPTEIVGHAARGIDGEVEPQKGCHLRADVPVAEAMRQMSEATQGVEQGHDARIAKAQTGRAATRLSGRSLDAVQCFLGEDALMADPLNFQQLAIDLGPERAEVRKLVDALPDIEVTRIVDRRFRAERAILFEVLLDVGVLVVHVEAGTHASGDDPGPVAAGRSRGPGDPFCGEQQAHLRRTAEVEVFRG